MWHGTFHWKCHNVDRAKVSSDSLHFQNRWSIPTVQDSFRQSKQNRHSEYTEHRSVYAEPYYTGDTAQQLHRDPQHRPPIPPSEILATVLKSMGMGEADEEVVGPLAFPLKCLQQGRLRRFLLQRGMPLNRRLSVVWGLKRRKVLYLHCWMYKIETGSTASPIPADKQVRN